MNDKEKTLGQVLGMLTPESWDKVTDILKKDEQKQRKIRRIERQRLRRLYERTGRGG